MTNRSEAGVRVSFNSEGAPPIKCDRTHSSPSMATVVVSDGSMGHAPQRFHRVIAAKTTEDCPVC
jgi:hypothetical protein